MLARFMRGAMAGGAVEAMRATRECRLWPGVEEKSTCFLSTAGFTATAEAEGFVRAREARFCRGAMVGGLSELGVRVRVCVWAAGLFGVVDGVKGARAGAGGGV